MTHFVELPKLRRQAFSDFGYAALIISIAVVRAKTAAAIVRSTRLYAFAATPVNAVPSRGEPGEITPEYLIFIVRVIELDPLSWEVKRNFGHARSLGVR